MRFISTKAFLETSSNDVAWSLISAQANSNGNVIHSEILGIVKMKCYLSCMPELRLGLNDEVMFETMGCSASFIHILLSTRHDT